MASAYRQADGLGLYLTGAASDGAAQTSPDAALGGFRSATEVRALGGLVTAAIPPLSLQLATGANGEGTGTITADAAGDLTYTPPGGAAGSAVAIANGETKLIVGNDIDKAVRVTRNTSDTPSGSMTIDYKKSYNDALGLANVANAERSAGGDRYRAIMLRAHGAFGVLNTRVWVGTLGTQATTDTGQLSGAGTGVIKTAGSFADWPKVGFARIQTSGGALREIVYYSARTHNSLTIGNASHRGLLGSSAGAGAATDTVDAVPGIRIALETPAADQSIQTIANESTAPGGVSWSTGITAATGLSIGIIDVSKNHGLWIHREFPANGKVAYEMENLLNYDYWAA